MRRVVETVRLLEMERSEAQAEVESVSSNDSKKGPWHDSFILHCFMVNPWLHGHLRSLWSPFCYLYLPTHVRASNGILEPLGLIIFSWTMLMFCFPAPGMRSHFLCLGNFTHTHTHTHTCSVKVTCSEKLLWYLQSELNVAHLNSYSILSTLAFLHDYMFFWLYVTLTYDCILFYFSKFLLKIIKYLTTRKISDWNAYISLVPNTLPGEW